jgi:hypothetical protein
MTSVVPIVTPIISRAGNKASIANATTDIKEAISATNSNWEVSIFFLHGQKYGISLVSSLFSGIQSLKLKTAETNCTLNFISNYPTALFFIIHLTEPKEALTVLNIVPNFSIF